MTAALKSNMEAPTPDLSGVEFAISADGMPVARIADHVLAMVTAPSGFAYLASAVFDRRPLAVLTRADFIGHDGRVCGEAEFRARVAETAGHKRDLAKLNRVQTRMSASTPWGGSQMTVIYADGIVAHSTAGHGGFHLSADRNAEIHPLLRKDTPWYEEDCEWAIVALSFPSCSPLTSARWPKRSSAIPGRMNGRRSTAASWLRAKAGPEIAVHSINVMRRTTRHVGDLSDQNPGMTEVVAVVGSDGKSDNDERRFLVPSDEYAGRGRFGFVIDLARHAEYNGPSSFVGWRGRKDGT